MKPLKTKVSITLDAEIVDKIRMPDLSQASVFYQPYSV